MIAPQTVVARLDHNLKDSKGYLSWSCGSVKLTLCIRNEPLRNQENLQEQSLAPVVLVD
jgi:hypothetical protein